MANRIVGAAVGAAQSVVGVFSAKKPKVTERRLLPILQRGQKLFVVGKADDFGGFVVPPKMRAISVLTNLLRGTKEIPGPIPFFNKTTYVVDLAADCRRNRANSFIERHIEYDVIVFHLCSVLGKGSEQQQVCEMEKSGFSLCPLNEHSLVVDMKRVLRIR